MRRLTQGCGCLLFLIASGFAAVWPTENHAHAAERAVVSPTAERLVDEARQAQMEGDISRHFSLLRQAVQISPNYSLARWQLGQLQVDGQWVAVEEAQRRASADPKQAQYRELRKMHGETPQGQLALARWCRKNKLHDEARFHWASVLAVDPRNEEALRAIDMRWFNGRLLAREEIASQRKQMREWKRAVKEWEPRVARWQRDVWGVDAAEREAALVEIRAIGSIEAIPALEALTLGERMADEKHADKSREFSLAFLEALNTMRESAATMSLVRHAVFSPIAEVRTAAIQSLKTRPQHEYVPPLLNALAMPVESSFSVQTSRDGSVQYRHSLYREGADQDWEMDTRLAAMQNDLGGRHYTYDVVTDTLEIGLPNGSWPREMAAKADVASRYLNRYGKAAAATEMKVWQINQATEAFNALLMDVLAGATGEQYDMPREWWDWWQEFNEYYASGERPVQRNYHSDTDSYYYGAPSFEVRYPPPPPPPPTRLSCFAKGTLVWTKTGQRAIETLELGDLVLAQDAETGELAYKPVIGRTVRPPSEILRLSLGGNELRTTLGHPFWVVGVGWRMAKELEEGAVLHGVARSPRVRSVEKVGQDEAYNLVVADFNTYFVGEHGLLVHDNTPRRPTRAALPGLAAK